jgi:hypothetical protein
VRPQNQILLGEPLAVQRGAEDELRYSGSDARGLRYDAYVAGDSEPLVERCRRSTGRGTWRCRGTCRRAHRDLAHQWTDGCRRPRRRPAIEEHLRRDFRYDLNSPSQGGAAAGRPLPLRVEARATASSSRRRWR